MIYLSDIPDSISPAELERALIPISPQRYKQAVKYKFDLDRMLCAKSYLLLKQGLELEYGIKENPIFEYGEHGKPSIQGLPDIHFNLSHCKKGVICALDHQPVGIDIEQIIPFDPAVAQFVLNGQEYREVVHSPNPDIAFIRLWTMKESLLKLTGEGIRNDLKTLLTSSRQNGYQFHTVVHAERRYVYTLCRYQ